MFCGDWLGQHKFTCMHFQYHSIAPECTCSLISFQVHWMLLTPAKFDVGYKVPRRSKGIQQPYASCSQSQIHPTLHLRRGLNLSHRLPDLETCLLSQLHNLESLEIGQSPSPLLLRTLLGPRALLPLRLNTSLLPLLLDNTSSCTTGELLEDQRCEDELCECDRLTGNGGLAV